MMDKSLFHVLDKLGSRRLTAYLVVLIIVGILLVTRFGTAHDELRSSLVVELLGAFILLISFDLLQSWRINRAQRNEANYRLYLVYQLIYPHAKRYTNYYNDLTSDLIATGPIRDLTKIDFVELRHFYNASLYTDTPNGALVYHFYFDSLFRMIEEVQRAVYSLNPVHHFQIMELFREFIQENEKVYRLYNYFKSVEISDTDKEHFQNELLKFMNGHYGKDIKFIASKPNALNPYAKLYLLTIYNIEFLVKLSEKVNEGLKDFHDPKAGNLKFDFD